ncbi:MAG: hypothetical protein OEM52_12005 [bacterium]|nr:hypothetical protein [bacterium]
MKLLGILILVLLIAFPTFATIRIVDNSAANPTAYQTVQAAHDAASIGDTIYVVGSTTSYGYFNSNKRLVWMGPGYFLDQNTGSQARLPSATISNGQFAAGSSGSIFCGISVANYIMISVNDIVIRRCNFFGADGYNVYATASNILIEQCYISNPNTYMSNVISLQSSHDVTIRNCYIYAAAYNAQALHSLSEAGPIDVRNCIIYGNISLTNVTFTDNILRNATNVVFTGTAYYNLCDGSQFGTTNGNQANVNMSTVFVGTGSSDAQWQLATGSPAISAGRFGGNCGMYGGDAPYILSGIPPIPTITLFDAPATGSTLNGLQTRIQARSRN